MLPSFSIVIPSYNREKALLRAIDSVLRQSYEGPFEVIVVDDGSTDGTEKMLEMLRANDPRVRVIKHRSNLGKVAARNTGSKDAKNEWTLWLDSDDELYSSYLEIIATAIEKFPECRLFTCGAIVFNDKSPSFHLREAFSVLRGLPFKSGHIGTGSFIFRSEDYVELPESPHAYGGPDSFSALVQKKYPEIAALYGRNSSGSYLPLGNPFGDDYVEFFLLSQKSAQCVIPLPLYIQHVRQA